MIALDHLKGILSISACSWLIFGVYISIKIERFIITRYEVETSILDTVFFKEHATFTKSIPNFFSSAMYSSHLLMLLWGWRIYKNKKMYRDIKDPRSIIENFSPKEIRMVKSFAVSCIIVFVHIAAYYALGLFWPETFS